MNEIFKLIKKYPQIFFGVFIVFSFSCNMPNDFLIKAMISFVITYYALSEIIYKFAIWAYFTMDIEENNLGEMFFGLLWVWVCLCFYMGLISRKILLSPIWDVLMGGSNYSEKIIYGYIVAVVLSKNIFILILK